MRKKHRKRRSSQQLSHEILTTMADGANKLDIVEKVGMNHRDARNYIDELLLSGCLYIKGPLYYTSDAGFEFLETYDKLVEMMQ